MEEYLKSLEVLWSKIESIDFELPIELEKQIRTFIDAKFLIPEISFKRVYPSFERLTVNKRLPNNNNKRIDKIRHLYNPPSKYIRNYGRANLKNQSIFYATFLTPTAIDELKPEEGDLITISKWSILNREESLHVFPIFLPENVDSCKKLTGIVEQTKAIELSLQYDELLKNYSNEEGKVILALQKFISNCFSKRISSETNNQYVVTASLANKLLYKMFDGTLEAITYPSVQDSTGIDNIALKPSVLSQKYALTKVTEFLVLKNSIDIKALPIHGVSNKFIGGKIIWE
ncbi:MAG: hypothetical protein ABJK11_08010 [Balneola sp.]